MVELEALTVGMSLRVYHCTRLLDGEAAGIRRDGLAPLSRDLMAGKICGACEGGWLSVADGDVLLAGNAVDCGSGLRLGLVWAVAGRSMFDEDPGAVELLLTFWGGEACRP